MQRGGPVSERQVWEKKAAFLVLLPQWACSDKTFIRVLMTVIKDMTLTLGECQKPSPAVAEPFICGTVSLRDQLCIAFGSLLCAYCFSPILIGNGSHE